MTFQMKMTNHNSYTGLCGIGEDMITKLGLILIPSQILSEPNGGGWVTPNQHCSNYQLKAPPSTFDFTLFTIKNGSVTFNCHFHT